QCGSERHIRKLSLGPAAWASRPAGHPAYRSQGGGHSYRYDEGRSTSRSRRSAAESEREIVMPILLIHALIWMIVVLVVAWVVIVLLKQIPGLPAVIATLVWVIAVLICLMVLLQVFMPMLKLG